MRFYLTSLRIQAAALLTHFSLFLQNLKNERYRFKVVVTELDKTAAIEFKVALLAFINCVIISAKTLQDRLRVRNEFIGECLDPNPINYNLSPGGGY